MQEMEIRPAQESESAQIKELIHLVGINPTGLDWKRFLVAVEPSGRIISCGQIKPHGADILELASIATHPDFRGLGIARMIIERLIGETPRPIYLMCVEHNGPMYEKFGFKRLGEKQMPGYFRRINKLFTVAKAVGRTDENLWVMKLE